MLSHYWAGTNPAGIALDEPSRPTGFPAALPFQPRTIVFQLCISAVAGWVNRGQQHQRAILVEYIRHYRAERNHQGLDNALLTPLPANSNTGARPDAARRESGYW